MKRSFFTNLIRSHAPEPVSDTEHIKAENDFLRRSVDLLNNEITHLRARVLELEADEREIRLSLLRRSGILPSEKEIDKQDKEFKSVKKHQIPWSQQAAKLEADSRHRYWTKQIELAEQPQAVRKARAAQDSVHEDFDKDMAVLEDVSSNNS